MPGGRAGSKELDQEFVQEALVLDRKVRNTKPTFFFWEANQVPRGLTTSTSAASAARPEKRTALGV